MHYHMPDHCGIIQEFRGEIPDISIVAVEPEESPILSKGEKGPHRIEGIGAGFVPDVLDQGVIDEIRTVNHETAAAFSRRFARE